MVLTVGFRFPGAPSSHRSRRSIGSTVTNTNLTSTTSSHHSHSLANTHPDAIKRRLQAEEREKRRRLELEMEMAGRRWWHDDGIIRRVEDPEDYHNVIRNNATSNHVLVIKFFSEECYSCKTLYPKLKKIAESTQGEVTFVKINGSDPQFQPIFQKAGITAVPWFHMYLQGKREASLSASLNPERLQLFREQIDLLRCQADC